MFQSNKFTQRVDINRLPFELILMKIRNFFLKTSTNHAVVIVGYGIDEGTRKPYWIVFLQFFKLEQK